MICCHHLLMCDPPGNILKLVNSRVLTCSSLSKYTTKAALEHVDDHLELKSFPKHTKTVYRKRCRHKYEGQDSETPRNTNERWFRSRGSFWCCQPLDHDTRAWTANQDIYFTGLVKNDDIPLSSKHPSMLVIHASNLNARKLLLAVYVAGGKNISGLLRMTSKFWQENSCGPLVNRVG